MKCYNGDSVRLQNPYSIERKKCQQRVALVEKRSILPETGTEQWRSVRGTLADTLVAGHLLERRKEDWVFSWRRKKAKEATADGEVTVPMGLFIAQGEEDESVAMRRHGFLPQI